MLSHAVSSMNPLILVFAMSSISQEPLDTHKFRKAIREGDLNTVQSYLKADPGLATLKNEAGLSALMLSVYFQEPKITKELISHCGPLDVFEAAAVGDAKRLKQLLSRFPEMAKDVYVDGHAPLHLSAFFGHVESSELLLQFGADPNYKVAPSDRTPLHSACATASEEVSTRLVALMLKRGANPNVKQEGEFMPLHESAAKGHLQNVRALVEAGSKLSEKSKDGKTPLGYALAGGHTDVADFLKSKGAK